MARRHRAIRSKSSLLWTFHCYPLPSFTEMRVESAFTFNLCTDYLLPITTY